MEERETGKGKNIVNKYPGWRIQKKAFCNISTIPGDRVNWAADRGLATNAVNSFLCAQSGLLLINCGLETVGRLVGGK